MKTRHTFTPLLSAALSLCLFTTGCGQNPDLSSENPETDHQPFMQDTTICYTADHSEVTHLQFNVLYSGQLIGGFFLVKNAEWNTLTYAFSGENIGDSLYRVILQTLEGPVEEEWTLHTRENEFRISGVSLLGQNVALTAIACEEFPDYYGIRSTEDIRDFFDPDDSYENEKATCFYIYHSTRGGRIHTQEYLWLETEENRIRGCGTGVSEGEPDWGFTFEGYFTEEGRAAVTLRYLKEGYVEIKCCDTLTREEIWQIDLTKGTIRLDHAAVTDQLIPLEGELFTIPCDAVDKWARKNMSRILRRLNAEK